MINDDTTIIVSDPDFVNGDVKSFTLMQFMNPRFWDEDYWDCLEDGDIEGIGNLVLDRLARDKIVVREFHLVVHDRDTKDSQSDVPVDDKEIVLLDYYDHDNDDGNSLVPPHIHMVIRMDRRRTILSLSELLGLSPYKFRKLTKGRYNRPNALSYLIHIKYPEKYLYDPSDVVTIVPNEKDGDYLSIYEKYKEPWLRYRESRIRELSKGGKGEPDFEYHEVGTASDGSGNIYRNYDIVRFLDGINSGDIGVGEIFNSPRLRSLEQMFTLAVEKALNKDLDPVNKWILDEIRDRVYRDNSIPTYQFVYTGPGRTGKTSIVNEIIDDLIEMSTEYLPVPFESFYGGNNGDMSDGYDGEEIAVYDDITSGSADYESFISLDNNFAKGRKAHIRHKSKPYYAMLNFYIMNSNLKSIYYNSKCEDPCGKDKNSFFEKMHYIFDVVERADYRNLHTANVVKFYTYSEYHRDLMNRLLEEAGLDVRLDSESFDDEIGLTVYVCSELISLNDSREIVKILSEANQISRLKNLIIEKGLSEAVPSLPVRPDSSPETILSANAPKELSDGN